MQISQEIILLPVNLPAPKCHIEVLPNHCLTHHVPNNTVSYLMFQSDKDKSQHKTCLTAESTENACSDMQSVQTGKNLSYWFQREFRMHMHGKVHTLQVSRSCREQKKALKAAQRMYKMSRPLFSDGCEQVLNLLTSCRTNIYVLDQINNFTAG